MIRSVSNVFFRDMNVSLQSIGLASLFGLPWILKFLWGPLVDEYSTKRRWLLTMQIALLIIFGLAAAVIPLKNSVALIAVLFFIGSFLAATHDIAIDGYYMEALDKAGQAKFVGYRTAAFRIAMMTGTMVIVTLGANVNWFLAFWTAMIIFGLFLLYHLFFLPEVQTPQKPIKRVFKRLMKLNFIIYAVALVLTIAGIRLLLDSQFYLDLKTHLPFLNKMHFSHWTAILLLLGLLLVYLYSGKIKAMIVKDPDSQYSRAFVSFMDRDKIGIILAFIILLRAGEWTLSTMAGPFFWDVGVKKIYGIISAWIGLPMSIFGALLGGWMISRFSLKQVIFPFIFLQNATNLIFMGLALHLAPFVAINTGVQQPTDVGLNNVLLIAAVHGFDQFAGGLGTAVLMTYLMRICRKEHKAAHYAIGSGLMSVTGVFAGVLSGIVAQKMGYAWLFGLSFAVSIPAMLLIPFLPQLTDSLKQPNQ